MENALLQVHWSHVVSVVAVLFGIVGVYHRMFIAPVHRWRESVNGQLVGLDKRIALVEQRLMSGDEKFDAVMEELKQLRACVQEMKVSLARLSEKTS